MFRQILDLLERSRRGGGYDRPRGGGGLLDRILGSAGRDRYDDRRRYRGDDDDFRSRGYGRRRRRGDDDDDDD